MSGPIGAFRNFTSQHTFHTDWWHGVTIRPWSPKAMSRLQLGEDTVFTGDVNGWFP